MVTVTSSDVKWLSSSWNYAKLRNISKTISFSSRLSILLLLYGTVPQQLSPLAFLSVPLLVSP